MGSRKNTGDVNTGAGSAASTTVVPARPHEVDEADDLDFTPKQVDRIQELIAALMPQPDHSPLTVAGPTGQASDLYILKYRRGMTGVQTGFIRATSMVNAEKVGHAYCDSLVGCRYINVVKAVVADEMILDKSDAGRELREKLAGA